MKYFNCLITLFQLLVVTFSYEAVIWNRYDSHLLKKLTICFIRFAIMIFVLQIVNGLVCWLSQRYNRRFLREIMDSRFYLIQNNEKNFDDISKNNQVGKIQPENSINKYEKDIAIEKMLLQNENDAPKFYSDKFVTEIIYFGINNKNMYIAEDLHKQITSFRLKNKSCKVIAEESIIDEAHGNEEVYGESIYKINEIELYQEFFKMEY